MMAAQLSWRSLTAAAELPSRFGDDEYWKLLSEISEPNGNFRSDNTDAFLWLLQGGFPITVEEAEDRVVLRAR